MVDILAVEIFSSGCGSIWVALYPYFTLNKEDFKTTIIGVLKQLVVLGQSDPLFLVAMVGRGAFSAYLMVLIGTVGVLAYLGFRVA